MKSFLVASALVLVACDDGADPSSADASTSTDGGNQDGGSTPVDLGRAIGVVGCSNTTQETDGYLAVSTQDRLIDTAQGGMAMTQWAVTTGGPWRIYDNLRPASGYAQLVSARGGRLDATARRHGDRQHSQPRC
ncbi:MAG: hypothetical protein ACKV2T_02100 [Kofleriaceae bacterium]